MAHRKMTAAVVSQEALAADIYSMWMEAEEIAKEAKPGQFISVYSRDGAKDRMMEHLEDMMREAGSEKEREAIRRCMTQMENA